MTERAVGVTHPDCELYTSRKFREGAFSIFTKVPHDSDSSGVHISFSPSSSSHNFTTQVVVWCFNGFPIRPPEGLPGVGGFEFRLTAPAIRPQPPVSALIQPDPDSSPGRDVFSPVFHCLDPPRTGNNKAKGYCFATAMSPCQTGSAQW